MNQRYTRWIVLIAIAMSLIVTRAIADNSLYIAIGQLHRLSDSGEFAKVLNVLQTYRELDPDPQVASLVENLQQHESHVAQWTAKRNEDFDAAIKLMVEKFDQNKIEDALVHAVDARNLTDDHAKMVEQPEVQQLFSATLTQARQAEHDGDWLHALSLYRAVRILQDSQVLHRESVDNAARHLRLLKLYGPDELHRLYELRRQRLDKPEDDALAKDEEAETWQQLLQGVDKQMFSRSLRYAANKHVTSKGYLPLLRGSIDALIVMADSRGMNQTFPSFGDPLKLNEFRTQLLGVKALIDKRGPALQDFDVDDVLDRVRTINSRTVALPESVLVFEMTDGAMTALDDFSSVIWPSETEHFNRNTKGKFFGVGIQISKRDGRLLVVSPLPGTPAFAAGIKAGDIIVQVDGRDTATWSLDRAVRQITGELGSTVTLGIERAGERDPLTFPIKRAEIAITSIQGWKHLPNGKWDYLIDAQSKVGYIRLSQFIPQTADDLDAAINELEAQTGGLRGLILDLRFNPGGLLKSAVEVTDRFIRSGYIVSTVGSNGIPSSPIKATPHHTHRNFELVVLINEGSASASEIVAGALQDHGRAVIVGTRSFGKGSVQDMYQLDRTGSSFLKLTTQFYVLPKGRRIHRMPESREWGIEPDLIVKMTEQQVKHLLEFRQDLDVLRDEKPAQAPVIEAEAAPEQGEGVAVEPVKPPLVAEHILQSGLDPQLESALLVLKTRLVIDRMVTFAQRLEVEALPTR